MDSIKTRNINKNANHTIFYIRTGLKIGVMRESMQGANKTINTKVGLDLSMSEQVRQRQVTLNEGKTLVNIVIKYSMICIFIYPSIAHLFIYFIYPSIAHLFIHFYNPSDWFLFCHVLF